MNIQRTSILLAASLLCSVTAHAVVRPASHFLDNMVIQRDTAANVWGTADPGESVVVSGSWGQEASATADGKGAWMVQLQTPAAGGPYTLTFQGGNRVVLENVLSGDVWICSGQSNMGFTVRGSLNSKEEMANANYPEIRNIIVPLSIGTHPKNEFNGRWDVCSPKSVANLSGVGYFFARELHTNTNVPIGLIKVAWGGTRIEPWTPPIGFELVPQLSEIASKVNATIPTMREGNTAYKAYLAELKQWLPQADAALANMAEVPQSPSEPSLLNNNREPTVLYNGMIHPLVPLSIKGAIWYQGEANGSEGISYFHKMQALIGGWREVFGQGDFPFYYVQLANFQQSDPNKAEGGDGWSKIRQAQLDALSIPNTGMATIIDIGEAKDIHPKNKQDVGKRLARWALAKDYGQNIVYSGPLFKQLTIRGSKAVVAFDHLGSGLMVATKKGLDAPVETANERLKWFSVRDASGKWYKADAVIEGANVVVSAPQVSQPTAVRYAYAMNPEGCNLYNREGLPASPFSAEE